MNTTRTPPAYVIALLKLIQCLYSGRGGVYAGGRPACVDHLHALACGSPAPRCVQAAGVQATVYIVYQSGGIQGNAIIVYFPPVCGSRFALLSFSPTCENWTRPQAQFVGRYVLH